MDNNNQLKIKKALDCLCAPTLSPSRGKMTVLSFGSAFAAIMMVVVWL